MGAGPSNTFRNTKGRLSDLSASSSSYSASSAIYNHLQQKLMRVESQLEGTLNALMVYVMSKEGSVPEEFAGLFALQPQGYRRLHADIATVAGALETPHAGDTHTIADTGNDALASILKKMEEMENENKALRDQMKEHQERVDKIPGAPKLLPKRDVGRFVEQPYSEGEAPHSIPKTFKMPPYLKIYDGTTDPKDHIIHYVTAVKGNDLSKEQVSSVLLKKFGKTLTGGALTWYSQLPARSISTFEEIADKFVTAHAGAIKEEARVNDIFAVRQTTAEGLRDFVARFNR
ncbi:PREDICTED: uncharacterized protein LOC109220035 [Nicotiana attenuata]|uniref:uncharacterized protein LOC109220035 n=1 Tax=Nicotiana attenuata TaxID=49451 RepID=UPI000904612D|nr:PREDICTED: uncharacterized protein LOC109220035 [Nicotiana attenuata]